MKQLKFKNTISEFTLSKSERRILFSPFFLAIVQDWIKQAEERALTQFDVTAFYRNRPPSDLYKGANINNKEIPRYFEFIFIRWTNYRRSVQAQCPILGHFKMYLLFWKCLHWKFVYVCCYAYLCIHYLHTMYLFTR